MITVIFLAGGTGSRLWPVSRQAYPKQFISLFGDKTMLQSTVDRVSDLDIRSSITVCNQEYRFFVAEQFRDTNQSTSIVLEPFSRNTAPAITVAAMLEDKNNLLLVIINDFS